MKKQTCLFKNLHLRVYFCGYCGNINNKKYSIMKKERYQKRNMPRMRVTSYKELKELNERAA